MAEKLTLLQTETQKNEKELDLVRQNLQEREDKIKDLEKSLASETGLRTQAECINYAVSCTGI